MLFRAFIQKNEAMTQIAAPSPLSSKSYFYDTYLYFEFFVCCRLCFPCFWAPFLPSLGGFGPFPLMLSGNSGRSPFILGPLPLPLRLSLGGRCPPFLALSPSFW